MMNRKAQTWSLDLIIGVLVFILVIFIFYSLIRGEKTSTIKDLSTKADLTAEKLFEMGLVDPQTGEFDDQAFLELASTDYETLKSELGIAGDFCLFVETNDDPPSVMFISNQNGTKIWTGIGSPDLEIGNFSCGTEWNLTS